MITAHGILQSGGDVAATISVIPTSMMFDGTGEPAQSVSIAFTQELTHKVDVTRVDTGDGLDWLSASDADIIASPASLSVSCTVLRSDIRRAQLKFELVRLSDNAIIDTKTVNVNQSAVE